MKTRWLPIVGIALLAGALVAYKHLHRDSRRPASRVGAEATAASGLSVLLFADPREADSADPCAEIFRLVRSAGSRGVRVREFTPDRASVEIRYYHVTVEPTVLVLDASGQVVVRHEGESPATITAIRSSLDQLSRNR